MAFSGAPVVTKISDSLARITGVTLGSGSTGEIGLAGSGAEIELPVNWAPYAGDDAGDDQVDLAEACEVSYVFVTDTADSSASSRIAVQKANGGDPATFLISFVSFDTLEAQSAEMEIYVRFH
jgi:hypothetical protein